ncbi:hypothetical protein I4U23_026364 [Adineta vaga]|nr:hypothetical protein I4U23_026364 [Adineta vaga]
MAAILLISVLNVSFLLGLSLFLTIILFIQLFVGIWNVIKNWHSKKLSNYHSILNLYLFHHLIICIIRSIIIVLACLSIFIFHYCLSIEIFLHFVSLLSTFDLLLIIVGETAHFWDSTINHKSSIYSSCCLIFGIFLNYFMALLFLSIHITINGNNPFLIEICQITSGKDYLNRDKSLIPTIITYILFLLMDLITFSWIFMSYRDISNLKRKRLATVFFSSLIFTHFKEHERSAMVNHSLKRLFNIILFLISNIILILPIITIKLMRISLTTHQRLFFLYLTTLPWIDCIAFLFYDEMKFNSMKWFSKGPIPIPNQTQVHQQRVGRRLSAYQECVPVIQIIEEK